MGKKLAIKGHATRGKEVIELLQMMGGHATVINKISNETDKVFFISDTENCFYRKSIRFIPDSSKEIEEFIIFTLEEFLKKYPFKVGDKVSALFQSDKTATNGFCSIATVTIKSMSWSEDCETMVYDFKDSVIVLAAEDLLKYNAEFLVNKEKSEEVGKMLCDMTLKHLHGNHLKNVLSELYEHIKSTPKEDLEREFEEIKEWTNVGPTVDEFITFCECVKKKHEYPKTYEECREILEEQADVTYGYNRDILHNLQVLLVCRDAYWKIAGEEMSLGKPWKPNWMDETTKYGIRTYQNTVIKDNVIRSNCALVFPTIEIRDVFYDNFKDLIESCKELL